MLPENCADDLGEPYICPFGYCDTPEWTSPKAIEDLMSGTDADMLGGP